MYIQFCIFLGYSKKKVSRDFISIKKVSRDFMSIMVMELSRPSVRTYASAKCLAKNAARFVFAKVLSFQVHMCLVRYSNTQLDK